MWPFYTGFTVGPLFQRSLGEECLCYLEAKNLCCIILIYMYLLILFQSSKNFNTYQTILIMIFCYQVFVLRCLPEQQALKVLVRKFLKEEQSDLEIQ